MPANASMRVTPGSETLWSVQVGQRCCTMRLASSTRSWNGRSSRWGAGRIWAPSRPSTRPASWPELPAVTAGSSGHDAGRVDGREGAQMRPAPHLDDRPFQDLVDDAKRMVQQRCPTWTDHNVSDPGVTLIEAFAGMVDQLIYRLNRVPDRNYIKFLDLVGVQMRPPTAARGRVTFWLSAAQPQTVVVRGETEVATP